MKTKLFHTVTLGTMLTLAVGPHAHAMDHSKMDHSKMGHGTAAAAPADAAGREIRTAVVNGYTLTYTRITTPRR